MYFQLSLTVLPPRIKSSCLISQDVLDSKNSAIKDLQYELARVCKVGGCMCDSTETVTHFFAGQKIALTKCIKSVFVSECMYECAGICVCLFVYYYCFFHEYCYHHEYDHQHHFFITFFTLIIIIII